MFDLSTIKAKNRQAAAKFKKPLHSQPLCSSPDVKIRECINDFIVTGLGPNGGLLVTPANKGAKSFLRKMFAFSEDYRGGVF